ncbi:hypothetical protein OC845_005618 [Tilletia horrida]|nr:hypothetical protein OC845_005618 [Tilletia horrida]
MPSRPKGAEYSSVSSGSTEFEPAPLTDGKLRIPWSAVLLATGSAICIALPMLGLVYYLFIRHLGVFSGNGWSGSLYLFTTAPSARVLSFTQLSSTTMRWLSGPPTAALAWYVAGQWTKASKISSGYGKAESPSRPLNRPTAAQYSILQNLCISTGLTTLWDAMCYTFHLTSDMRHLRRHSVRAPTYFHSTVGLLAAMVILTYSCAGLDSAIHFTTNSGQALIPFGVQDNGGPGMILVALGRALNTTRAISDLFVCVRCWTGTGFQFLGATDSQNKDKHLFDRQNGMDRPLHGHIGAAL